jgi:hypothetical protein
VVNAAYPQDKIVPVPPAWLRRQEERSPANANRNINDIYWRKPDGWIVVGPSAVLGGDGRPLTRQAESLIRKGWEPLIEYSYTNKVSPKTGQRETIEVTNDRLNTPDRYYWLFANNGAHLFTIEQIVEHHWHLTPPYGLPLSVFPQLDEWEVPGAFYCPACPTDAAPKNSVGQVEKHLVIQHQMTINQVRDLQQATNDFQERPRGNAGIVLRRKVRDFEGTVPTAEVAAPSPDQPKGQLLICNACGELIKGKLADHQCAAFI